MLARNECSTSRGREVESYLPQGLVVHTGRFGEVQGLEAGEGEAGRNGGTCTVGMVTC